MKHILFCCLVIPFMTTHVLAGDADSTRTKKLDHYVGVQANQLLKQLINLNASSAVISNPYLLTYSLYLSKSKWGIDAGFGYNYRASKDKLSTADQESKINESFYRIGIGRKFHLGKRWEAAVAADYHGSYLLNKTFSFTVTEFGNTIDSTNSTSTSIAKVSGEGLRLQLGYNISKHVMLRTEMTFYYSKSNVKSHVLVSDTFTNIAFPEQNDYTIAASNTEVEESDFSITLPVAIFLTIKF